MLVVFFFFFNSIFRHRRIITLVEFVLIRSGVLESMTFEKPFFIETIPQLKENESTLVCTNPFHRDSVELTKKEGNLWVLEEIGVKEVVWILSV